MRRITFTIVGETGDHTTEVILSTRRKTEGAPDWRIWDGENETICDSLTAAIEQFTARIDTAMNAVTE